MTPERLAEIRDSTIAGSDEVIAASYGVRDGICPERVYRNYDGPESRIERCGRPVTTELYRQRGVLIDALVSRWFCEMHARARVRLTHEWLDEFEETYRRKMRDGAHPDQGGTDAEAAALYAAIELARKATW